MAHETIIAITIILASATITLCVLSEAYMLYQAYTGADRVTCNWLDCTFTTERGTEQIITTQTTIRNCYENGQPINCT